LQAELRLRQARLATARSQLARLEHLPRPEQLPPSSARIREARAQLQAKQAAFRYAQELTERSLMNQNELEQRKQAVLAAQEALTQAEAEDALLRAGTSEADKAVARDQVAETVALVSQIQTEIDRLQVRAPLAGTVLQVNIHRGEAYPSRTDLPPIVLGNTQPLQVRVELEEQHIARFNPSAPSTACPRGQSEPVFRLHFIRVEPLVVPRRILSGEGNERSDTRVLPLIYRLDPDAKAIYVGQQLEVYLAEGEK
jgi:multidrug resistance efflux pump